MIIQSCAETDEWVGISCPACCLPKMRSCLTSGVIIKTPSFPNICLPCQHDPFQSHMRSMNSPKNFMCLLQAFWMTAVALEHTQRVSRQLQSLIRRRLPLWRIQHMLYIESVNSLVCHAWRLRCTVLMTSYKIVHISPGKRVAWSSKQPKVLHSTSYFLAIMPPKK